jgi:hypothetical protein
MNRNIYHGCVIVSTPTGRGLVYADSEGVNLLEDGYEHVVYASELARAWKPGHSSAAYNAACGALGEEVGRAGTLGEAKQIAKRDAAERDSPDSAAVPKPKSKRPKRPKRLQSGDAEAQDDPPG